MEHAETRRQRMAKARWYAFTKMQTRVATRLTRVITVSENSLGDIHRDHQVEMDRLHVVPVGVDPDLFSPKPEVTRRPGRLITTASADVTMKGLRYLLEAIAKLRTEREVDLVVIGRPKPGGPSAQTIEDLGLSEHVEFISGVPDERIVELYAEAELAVVPSLYEGFSLPAIEAMSCGVPLVATTGGALPEVTGTDGETCFQVPPGDSAALAAKIGEALDDADARARIGAAGRTRVIERWSWRHTAEATVEQYRALLDEWPNNRPDQRPWRGWVR
jgi:glycosyltransferase involved in cell wall biosynthesis